jgi:hypothetical protein
VSARIIFLAAKNDLMLSQRVGIETGRMEESGCAWHLDGTLETVLESGDGRLGHLDLLPRLQGSHLGVSQPLVFLTSLTLTFFEG